MNQPLYERLLALEPELRQIASINGGDASVTMSFDANGTTFSHVQNDGLGGSESWNKRIPRQQTKP